MLKTTINELRFLALRDPDVYQSMLANAEQNYAVAVEEIKRSAVDIDAGKPYDIDHLASLTEAVERTENSVRYYRQLPDLYRAYRMGIEIPANKFEKDDMENGVLREEAVWWLEEAIKAKKQSKSEYYVKVVVPILALLVAAIGVLVAAFKHESASPKSDIPAVRPTTTAPTPVVPNPK